MEDNIKNKEPSFSENISTEAKELISKLLHKNPSKRMQSLSDLKKQKWLCDIDWNSILERYFIDNIEKEK